MVSIGQFSKTEDGFSGTINTLAIQAKVDIRQNANKQQDNHPDFELLSEGSSIGATWSRNGKRGRHVFGSVCGLRLNTGRRSAAWAPLAGCELDATYHANAKRRLIKPAIRPLQQRLQIPYLWLYSAPNHKR